jgi:preprotein translocase subunit YajC
MSAFDPAAVGRRFFRGSPSISFGRDPEEVIVLVSLTPLVAQAGGGDALSLLLPLVAMVGIFYFLLIRPNQRRQRAQRDLLESLDVGDEVITIGGVYGTVRELDDEAVTLEVDDDVRIRFVKSAVARKLVFDDEEYEDEAEEQQQEAGEQK